MLKNLLLIYKGNKYLSKFNIAQNGSNSNNKKQNINSLHIEHIMKHVNVHVRQSNVSQFFTLIKTIYHIQSYLSYCIHTNINPN